MPGVRSLGHHAAMERHDNVFVLRLGDDENLINPDLLARVHEQLDEVERAPEPRALVTCGGGRFYSTGLDLPWMAANPDRIVDLVDGMHALFARLLELPVPTVAALNGHAFAGGAMLALSHDLRVMRADRGYFCLPEIDGRLAFTPGLSDLVAARLTPQVAHEAMTTGRRYTGPEARELAIVDRVAGADDVLPEAIALGAALSTKDATTYGTIRRRLYRHVIASLGDRETNLQDVVRLSAAMREAAR